MTPLTYSLFTLFHLIFSFIVLCTKIIVDSSFQVFLNKHFKLSCTERVNEHSKYLRYHIAVGNRMGFPYIILYIHFALF